MTRAIPRPVVSVTTAPMLQGGEMFEPGHLKDDVDRVTHQQVADRYGHPHRTERPSTDREAWAHFDRGSSVASYGGSARSRPCSEYHLGFDAEAALRDWTAVECGNQPPRRRRPPSHRVDAGQTPPGLYNGLPRAGT